MKPLSFEIQLVTVHEVYRNFLGSWKTLLVVFLSIVQVKKYRLNVEVNVNFVDCHCLLATCSAAPQSQLVSVNPHSLCKVYDAAHNFIYLYIPWPPNAKQQPSTS